MRLIKNPLLIGLTMISASAFSQIPIDGVHYAAGLNGIKAGIPDSPGVYFRDDNLFYFANRPANVDTFVYLQAPQLMWLTGWKVLGANIGADVMVPIIYKETDIPTQQSISPVGGFPVRGSGSQSQFGVGDIKIEPLLLAWHWNQLDLMAAAGVWTPTGHFVTERLDNLGDDEWSPMISLGAVWYPDKAKTWAISILNHYEFNCSQSGVILVTLPLGSNSGPIRTEAVKFSASTYTLEYAVSKMIFDHTDLGIAGYYQQQFSDGSFFPIQI